MTTVTAARQFLDLVWGFKKPNDWLLLWEKNGKRSHWFDDLEAAAESADGQVDWYLGCGLSANDNGPSKRATETQIVSIPGLWCDIDFGGNVAHKSKDLPPDAAAARSLLDSLGLPPTLIVHSGFGLQAWWLLEIPLSFSTVPERIEAKQISQALQDALIDAGKGRGWKVDSVGDLSRVLRLPGTRNGKSDPPVEVRLLVDDGPRYKRLADIVVPVAAGRLNFESNGQHHSNGSVDPNPEASTKVGRPTEEWNRILGGVGEGSRNNDMTALAGKLMRRIDVFNKDESEWEFEHVFLMRDTLNKPPLGRAEMRAIWKSIEGKEKRRRSESDIAQTVRMVGTADGGVRKWRAEIVQSEPPVYRVFSEHWSGHVEVNATVLASYSKFDVAVIEQKKFSMPDEYRKIWRKTPKNGEALVSMLLREAVPITATPEESDRSRLATAILASLISAPYRALSSTTREHPCKQQSDDSIIFGFRWLVGDINKNGTAKITEDRIARMLAYVSCGDVRYENVRFKSLSRDSVSKLRQIADGDEICRFVNGKTDLNGAQNGVANPLR